MMYRDRAEAGRRLVQRLRERIPDLDGEAVVVLGMVPGGVAVARTVALALRAPLDVAVGLRLAAPGYDALGIGGVAAGGAARVDARTIAMLGVSEEYVEQTIRARLAEAERLAVRCRGGRAPVPVANRRVIIVDDGAQTRYRSGAVIASARAAGAREVIFAVPVASSDMLAALALEADAVVCDHVPERHCGIGAHYAEWETPRIENLRGMLGGSAPHELPLPARRPRAPEPRP